MLINVPHSVIRSYVYSNIKYCALVLENIACHCALHLDPLPLENYLTLASPIRLIFHYIQNYCTFNIALYQIISLI